MSEHIDAAELLRALEKFQQQIAGFRPLSKEEIITIRKASSLDPDWILDAVATLGASDTIQRALQTSPDELHAEIAEANEWAGVESRLYALYKGVAATNLARRHRIGIKALQIYAFARQLVRRPEHHHLLPFVQRLQQMNKLGKRKKKTPPEE